MLPSLDLPGTFLDDVRLPEEFAGIVSERLGLPGFYSAYVLTYCEGDYRPNGTLPDAARNYTRCSNSTAMVDFNPARIIQEQLPAGITLADLNWPSSVDDGIRALRTAFRAMFVAFVIGIIATGLTMLTSAVGIFDAGRLTAGISSLLAMVSVVRSPWSSTIAAHAGI